MRTGTYSGAEDRPVIEATVLELPGTSSFSTSFLIDSGADNTVLGGIDAVRSGFLSEIAAENDDIGDSLPENVDIDRTESEGINGTTETYRVNESVLLTFAEQADGDSPANLHVEVLDGIIIVPSSRRSLLGRDVLNRFDVTFSHVNGEIDLQRHPFGEGSCMDITLSDEAMAAIEDLS